MAQNPVWTQRSSFWNSNSTQRRLMYILTANTPGEGDDDHHMPQNARRRVVLEVYEIYGEGILTQLDVCAVEQFISPSAPDTILESKQIGSCTGQLFDREHALNNSFDITTQNAGFQIRTFMQCAYTSTGALLPELIEPAHNPFDPQQPRHTAGNTPLTNRDLVGESSFVLLERISVQAAHRRRGLGTALLDALLAAARALLPAAAFAVSWPCAGDCDLADVGTSGTTTTTPAPGMGQRRAEAFHRAVGFRALGLTRFWAKRLP